MLVRMQKNWNYCYVAGGHLKWCRRAGKHSSNFEKSKHATTIHLSNFTLDHSS